MKSSLSLKVEIGEISSYAKILTQGLYSDKVILKQRQEGRPKADDVLRKIYYIIKTEGRDFERMKQDNYISVSEEQILKAFLGEHQISPNNRNFILTLVNKLAPVYFEAAFRKGIQVPSVDRLSKKEIEFAKKVGFIFVFKPQLELYCACTLNSEIEIDDKLYDDMQATLEDTLTLDANQVLMNYLNLLLDCSDLSKLEDGLRLLLI